MIDCALNRVLNIMQCITFGIFFFFFAIIMFVLMKNNSITYILINNMLYSLEYIFKLFFPRI